MENASEETFVLIGKYLSGELSPEEQLLFNNWLNESPGNREELNRIQKLDAYLEASIARQEADIDKGRIITDYKIWKNSVQKEQATRSSKKWLTLTNLLKIAAILLIFAAIAALSVNLNRSRISKSFTEVISPKGSRTQLKLADGTTVWLNAGSMLRYANNFDKKNRSVQIEGEAYFDVAHDPAHPFIVNTSSINLTVLGTSFNIKAYRDENTIETTLVKGTVEIEKTNKSEGDQKIILKPNQKALFVKDQNRLYVNDLAVRREVANPAETVTKPVKSHEGNSAVTKPLPSAEPLESAEVENTIAWKNGYLVFNNESLSNIIVILSRRYNVNFQYDNNEILKYHFTGKFKETTLEQVVQAIMLTSPLEVEVKQDQVFIKENPGLKKKYMENKSPN